MKTFKKFAAILFAVLMIFSLAACNGNNSEDSDNLSDTSYIREEKTKLAVPKGSALEFAMAKLAADRAYAYDVKFLDGVDEIVNLIKNGEIDIASLPVDAAAKLVNSADGIKIIAVNTVASFELLSKDGAIKSLEDLKGKTVYFSKEELAGEAFFSYLIAKNGIDVKEITFEYAATNAELAALAKEEKIDLCVLSNPVASEVCIENENVKNAWDLSLEWERFNETKLGYGVIVAREEYISAHPDYIETFFMQNEISVNYAQAVQEVSFDFFVSQGYYDDAEIAINVIGNSGLVFGKGEKVKESLTAVFNEIYKINPEIIGGKIPADSVYHIA